MCMRICLCWNKVCSISIHVHVQQLLFVGLASKFFCVVGFFRIATSTVVSGTK